MNRIYACLPCYNEEENIAALIGEWLAQYDELLERGYRLTVVAIDDCSTDGTFDIIADLRRRFPDRVRAIRHRENKNLGGGVATSFKLFRRECGEGDLCVLMDGDNTHDPKYVFSMIDRIGRGADCVIASRYCGASKVVGVPALREFLSDGAGVYYRLVLGVENVRDYTCGYRVYTYDIISRAYERYGNRLVEKRTFACMMEVLYKLSRVGARFDEVPFVLRYDMKQGESKMRIMKTIKDSLVTALWLRVTT